MAKSKTKDDLFGLDPLVVLGAALGGIALLSWIGETIIKSKECGGGCSKGKTDLAPVADEGLGMIAAPRSWNFCMDGTAFFCTGEGMGVDKDGNVWPIGNTNCVGKPENNHLCGDGRYFLTTPRP